MKVLFQAVSCCCNSLSSGVAVSFDTAVPRARFKGKSASVNNRFCIASFYIPHTNRSLDAAFKLSPNWQHTSNFLNTTPPPTHIQKSFHFPFFFIVFFRSSNALLSQVPFWREDLGIPPSWQVFHPPV